MTFSLRASSVVALSLSLCALSAGCGHMVETQTIAAWDEAMSKDDDRKLRELSTSAFKEQALASKEPVKLLKGNLDVPTGKSKIIKTVTESEESKRVTVEVGEAKTRVVYCMKRNPSGIWMVDDLYLNKRDLKNHESVKAKLNLVLSLQQFLDAWSSDNPELVKACSTDEFHTALHDLPPAELSRMTNRLTGELTSGDNVRPRLTLREVTAECKFTRKNSEVTVKFERAAAASAPGEIVARGVAPEVDPPATHKPPKPATAAKPDQPPAGRWLVTDVSIDSSRPGEDIASVKHMARVAAAAIAFHRAYSARSKEQLAEVCTKRFFEGSLSGADLTFAPLPPLDSRVAPPSTAKKPPTSEAAEQGRGRDRASSTAGDFGPEISVEAGTASYLWKTDKEIIRIGLLKDPAQSALPVYHVDDVTIYELDGRQNKRLSSLFTAQIVMQLFREALAQRDIQQLSLNSTHDFNSRVWKRLSPELARHMPLDAAPIGPEKILNVVFEGPLTSITLTVGERALTIILRDEQGKVLVDDVLLPRPGCPDSLKTTCEALIPAYQFAHCMMSLQIVKARGVASHEFNRLVWNQLPKMPAAPFDLPRHFAVKSQKVFVEPSTATVILGDARFGVKFLLVKEKDTFQVDDVVFVTGPESAQAVGLRRLLRTGIQTGTLSTTLTAPE